MVSIIVPVYNVEEYLPVCLESIIAQTAKDLEIILVDDGSTDRSCEICDECAARDERITVIHKENAGLVSARQAGLRIAHGKYICYVDSDDWVDETMCEDMLAAARRSQADLIVASNYYVEYPDAATVRVPITRIPEGVYQKEDGSINTIYRNTIFDENYNPPGIEATLCSILFKKSLLYKNQLNVDIKIRNYEDSACLYPCCAEANKISIIDGTYYHYRMRPGSMTHSQDRGYFNSCNIYYQRMAEAISEHPARGILIEQLNRDMLRIIVLGINEAFGLGLGTVVPYYLPPQEFLRQYSGRKIALYGAGGVGQSYHRLFQLAESVEIAAWVDRQWEKYQAEGLGTEPVSVLTERNYEIILIAIERADVAERIESDLLALGVPKSKIYWGKPRSLIQTV